MQRLLDDTKVDLPNDKKILHLQHAGQLLAPDRLFGEAGVDDGALVTLIFEGVPLKLRTVDRCFSHVQANAAASSLEL